jgi:imidazolonepropionase-like amidohydrolase
MTRFASCIAFALSLTGSLAAQRTDSTTFLVRGARVFDGSRMHARADVLVRDGKIVSLSPAIAPPAGVRVIDAAGKTLMPGLIDAHMHAVGDALRPALVFGVTTVLDMFNDPSTARRARADQAAGKTADQAELRSSGFAATAPGGHTTQFGLPVPTLTSADSAQSWVDARVADGSDYIKIVYDNGQAWGGSTPTISREILGAVIKAAHARQKLAVVHIHDLESARTAIELGADGLVHLFFDRAHDAAFVQLVRSRGAFVIPTLTVIQSALNLNGGAALASDERITQYLLPAEESMLRRSFASRSAPDKYAFARDAARTLHRAGVPILAGSDAGNVGTAQGASVHREIELLVEAGLTPTEALAAATSITAAAFKLLDRGRIAPGLRADLILVNGDPSRDIRATRDIAMVWKAGQSLNRERRLTLARNARAAVEQLRSAPAPKGSESGLVSDFESDSAGSATPRANFGAGWMLSLDAMMSGKSTGTLRVVSGGASGSAKALEISGRIDPAFAYPWAGAMFSPGPQPMAPANLSSKKEIVFWARGDGREYRVMLFAQSIGMQPAIANFRAPVEWTEVRFPFSRFGGIEGHDVQAILFSGGPQAGDFRFFIDGVRVQ